MKQIDELLNMWKEDCIIDRTEPGKALLDIPILHSKYVSILSKYRLLVKENELKFSKMKKLKWEYYTGRLDQETMKEYGWEPFQFTLKKDIDLYIESDDDLNKLKAQKAMYEEIVDLCIGIIKELNSRTYQLRSFIDYEKFINGGM